MEYTAVQLDPAMVRLQLERVLRSPIFARAQRSRDFLRYIVENGTTDPAAPIKEYTLATEVFGRDASYDPAVDATVRVEASRLRARLREYYAEEGTSDPILIDIPKGGYVPVLSLRPTAAGALPAPEEAISSPSIAAIVELPATSITPPHRRRLLIAVSAILIVLATAFTTRQMRLSRRLSDPPAAASPSLAILPIENKTGDPALDYLSDGLTESLIRELADVPRLKIIVRFSIFRYKGRAAEAAAIAHGFHVANVMTGELRGSTNHLVLNVELSSLADGAVLFSHEYLPEGSDLRPVQAEILSNLLNRLHLDANDPGLTSPTPQSEEAYNEVLRANLLLHSGSPVDLHQALTLYERAVALEPNFAGAWASLGGAHLMLGTYFESPREHMPLAREYAARALQLNPHSGEAHGVLGLVHLLYDWNRSNAESELGTGTGEQVSLVILGCTAHLLDRTGRSRNAEETLHQALAFDPESSMLISELGCVNYYRGRYDEAVARYGEAIRFDPRSPLGYWGLGKSLAQQSRFVEALDSLRQCKRSTGLEPPLVTAEIGYTLGRAGDQPGAAAILRQLAAISRTVYVDPYLTSVVYLGMNDDANALSWLDKAMAARSPFLISILTDPKWKRLNSDPRFLAIVNRMLTAESPSHPSASPPPTTAPVPPPSPSAYPRGNAIAG